MKLLEWNLITTNCEDRWDSHVPTTSLELYLGQSFGKQLSQLLGPWFSKSKRNTIEPQHIHLNCTPEPTGHSTIYAFGRLQVPMDGIHLLPPSHKGETKNQLVRIILGEEQLRAASFLISFLLLAQHFRS